MNPEKSSEDCYYYYYSTCTKGDSCPFRHCAEALGTENVCSFWLQNKCEKPGVCKFRHMVSRVDRSKVACFFERQPGGCRKPFCVFQHKIQPKIDINDVKEQDSGVILPVSSQSDVNIGKTLSTSATCDTSSIPNELINANILELTGNSINLGLSNSQSSEQFTSSPVIVSENIEPISFRIGPDEESDNDHEEHGSPTKRSKTSDENRNLGIKTLEQIRMEKIFKQAYNLSPHEVEIENNDTVSQMSPKVDKDLRVKLKRKSADMSPLCETNKTSDNALNFEIKPLDVIRKEKEARRSKSPIINNDDAGDPIPRKTKSSTKINRKNGVEFEEKADLMPKQYETYSKLEEETKVEQSDLKIGLKATLDENNVTKKSDISSVNRIERLDSFDELEAIMNNDGDESIVSVDDDDFMKEIDEVING